MKLLAAITVVALTLFGAAAFADPHGNNGNNGVRDHGAGCGRDDSGQCKGQGDGPGGN
jgi:hypothetical protein